jgi:hypothetical protein
VILINASWPVGLGISLSWRTGYSFSRYQRNPRLTSQLMDTESVRREEERECTFKPNSCLLRHL